jgi:hypothetical protein
MLHMRLLLVLAVAACSYSDDPSAQGACSNLEIDACLAKPNDCQMSFVFGGLAPTMAFNCLALEGDRPNVGACPQDHDLCRATLGCSPMFFQRTSSTDAAVGDPTYDHCELTETATHTN